MRAPGYAALTLIGVVALSGVLGMSYRSEASPYDPATSSAPASEPASSPATSSNPPAESPSPSDPTTSSPSPTSDSPSPSPSPTVHGPNPTITVASFSPGGATFTIGLSGGADSAVTTIVRQGAATVVQSCSSTTCAFTGLGGGLWSIQTVQTFPDGTLSYPTIYTLQIPDPPTIVVGADPFLLSGTGGTDGDLIHVALSDGTPVCDAHVQGGAWSCPGATAPTAAGSYRYVVVEEDARSGAQSEPSASQTFEVTPAISVPSPSTSTAPAPKAGKKSFSLTTLANWAFTVLGIDLNNVHPGDRFTVTGSDLPPGAIVTGELHSVAVPVGAALVGGDGTFSLPVVVPLDFEAGAHELVLTLTDPTGVAIASQQPLIVVPGSAGAGGAGSSSPDPNEQPATGSHTSTDPLGSDAASGGTNILTHGLNSIADVIAHPAKIPAAIEIGLVLLIFAVLPGHLLNATLAERYEEFMDRHPRRRRSVPGWWLKLHALLHRAPFLAGLTLTTVTALLFGFADPRFGFTLASLRLILGLVIALALVSYITSAIVVRIMRSRWNVAVEVSLRPLGLLLTVAGVVVSRVLDFSPGFLVGLVLGLVIQEKSIKQHAWRAVLLRTGILLGLTLVAWLGYSLFDTQHEGGTFASELAVETLVAITTEAVVGLLIELLPLRLLEGQKLFEKSRILWGALYLLAVFIFVVAVVPWEGNWAELGTSLWAWIGIVAGFGIVATGVYLYFRIRSEQEPTEVDDEEFVPVGEEPSAGDR